MSYRLGHPPLSSAGYAWLSTLSDPDMEYPIVRKLQSTEEIDWLAEAAGAHGTLPAFTRNLRKCLTAFGAASISSAPLAEEAISRALSNLDERITLITGQSLLLTHYQRQISGAIKKYGLNAAVIKGPVFARCLYQQQSDRSFTDVDVLVDTRSLNATLELVRSLGFVESSIADGKRKGESEFKWILPGNESIMVEIQTNLIHSGNGRGARLTYTDLLYAGDGDPEDATALLLTAALHALAGHQMERLQPVVDVLQAAREKAGPIDQSRLINVASALEATKTLQTALDVVSAIYADQGAADLANRLAPSSWRRLRAKLLTPTIVLRSQARDAGRDSWRRKIIRKIVN